LNSPFTIYLIETAWKLQRLKQIAQLRIYANGLMRLTQQSAIHRPLYFLETDH